jgi:RimJ/RimL family protein N-acetyltransferase
MELLTPRLRLDALREDDAAALFRYRADPDVARYQGWRPADEVAARRFIEAQRDVRVGEPDSWLQRAIRLRDGGELIGDLGVHFMPGDAATVELGISLAPAHQGAGLAREALCAVLDHVFGALGMHRACASVDPRNLACIHLLERSGLRKEAHFRESLRDGDGWADDVIYAVLAREWLAQRAAAPHRG